jgi:hypothetical protein
VSTMVITVSRFLLDTSAIALADCNNEQNYKFPAATEGSSMIRELASVQLSLWKVDGQAVCTFIPYRGRPHERDVSVLLQISSLTDDEDGIRYDNDAFD